MKIYDFSNKSRVSSHIELTPEQQEKVKSLMEVAEQFNKQTKEFADTLLNGYSMQFYGNYDYLIIRKVEENKKESEE